MSQKDLYEVEASLKAEFLKHLPGGRRRRTLEEALQEALDNDTPERPGTPSHHEEPESDDAEWI